jgi:aryl-alcohol dehydrogenase-like predicted oxidoreductase
MGTENRASLTGGDEISNIKEQENLSMQSIKLFLELGLNFFDTAWVCESNCFSPRNSGARPLCRDTTSEMILGRAVAHFGRKKFVLATTFYMQSVDISPRYLSQTFPQTTQTQVQRGLQPSYSDDNLPKNGRKTITDRIIRRQLAASLKRLGTDFIDLYYLQKTDIDHSVIEDVMHCVKALVRERKIKYVGLSVNSAELIRRAHRIHPITAIFAEYSFQYRDIEVGVLSTCRELGIGIVARRPYGCGSYSSSSSFGQPPSSRSDARGTGSPEKKIKKSTSQFIDLAAEKNCTLNQFALGWLHAQGIDVFPLIETNKVENVLEAFKALKIHLYGADLEEIGTIRL